MIDFAKNAIQVAKKSMHLYFEEKDMNYLLSHCIHDDIPLIGIVKPNWTNRLSVYSEHYQFYRQSEVSFVLYGKLMIRELSDSEEHRDTIQNITMNCLWVNNDIMFSSIHMSSVTEKLMATSTEAAEIQNFYRGAIENLYDVFIEYDNINNNFYYTADRFNKMFGCDAHFVNVDQIFWYICTEYIHPDDVEKMDVFRNVDLEKRIRTNDCKICYDVRIKCGEKKYKWIEITVVIFPNPVYRFNKIFMLFRDIDEKKRVELENISNARKDSLTGIYNRAYAEALINHNIANNRQASAMLLLDIDDFKNVNDTFGHLTGDEMICKIVSLINEIIGNQDVFGRSGGDEFIVYLKDRNSKEEIAALIEEIHKKTSFVHEEEGNTISIHTSIGAVFLEGEKKNTSFEEVYKRSDVILYQIKKGGKNKFRLVNL